VGNPAEETCCYPNTAMLQPGNNLSTPRNTQKNAGIRCLSVPVNKFSETFPLAKLWLARSWPRKTRLFNETPFIIKNRVSRYLAVSRNGCIIPHDLPKSGTHENCLGGKARCSIPVAPHRVALRSRAPTSVSCHILVPQVGQNARNTDPRPDLFSKINPT
jgi:hypothetical protein